MLPTVEGVLVKFSLFGVFKAVKESGAGSTSMSWSLTRGCFLPDFYQFFSYYFLILLLN